MSRITRTAKKAITFKEKVYIDELDLSFRADLWPAFEEHGGPEDRELFVRGLLPGVGESELRAHLAGEVAEVLLLRGRDGDSGGTGCGYLVFRQHKDAVDARLRLHGAPANSITSSAHAQPALDGAKLKAWFSESERCINGTSSVYGRSVIVDMLFGARGEIVENMRRKFPALGHVIFAGGGLAFGGPADADRRVHMMVPYKCGEGAIIADATRVWERCVENMHLQMADPAEAERIAAREAESFLTSLTGDGSDTEASISPLAEEDKTAGAPFLEESHVHLAGVSAAAPSVAPLVRPARMRREVVAVLRSISNGEETVDLAISGTYRAVGKHASRHKYRRTPCAEEGLEAVCLFWRTSGDDGPAGWVFAAESAQPGDVLAECLVDAAEPPEYGWELFAIADPDAELAVSQAEARQHNRPRRREAALEAAREAQPEQRQRQRHQDVSDSGKRPRSQRSGDRRGDATAASESLAPQPQLDVGRSGKRHRRHRSGDRTGDAAITPHTDISLDEVPPHPWQRLLHTGEYAGTFYYWNEVTGESSWHPPGREELASSLVSGDPSANKLSGAPSATSGQRHSGHSERVNGKSRSRHRHNSRSRRSRSRHRSRRHASSSQIHNRRSSATEPAATTAEPAATTAEQTSTFEEAAAQSPPGAWGHSLSKAAQSAPRGEPPGEWQKATARSAEPQGEWQTATAPAVMPPECGGGRTPPPGPSGDMWPLGSFEAFQTWALGGPLVTPKLASPGDWPPGDWPPPQPCAPGWQPPVQAPGYGPLASPPTNRCGSSGAQNPAATTWSSSSDTISYAGAKLGDAGVHAKCATQADGVPEMLQGIRSGRLDLVDFSNNNLTDKGFDNVVGLLIAHGRSVRKLKLHANRLSSLAPLSRLFDDPVCGLAAAAAAGGQQEIHLSHNQLQASAIEAFFATLAGAKERGVQRPRMPMFMRVEKNPCNSASLQDVVDRVQGLKVILLEKVSDRGRYPGDADVLLFAGGQ